MLLYNQYIFVISCRSGCFYESGTGTKKIQGIRQPDF